MCLMGEQQAHPGADSAWMVLMSISVSDLTQQSQRFLRLYAITLGGPTRGRLLSELETHSKVTKLATVDLN